MTDLTKLADALVEIANSESNLRQDERDSCSEAARILRAAAVVDVAGLMALIKEATTAHYWLGLASGAHKCTPGHHANKAAADAALESALRMALATREGFVLVPVEPTDAMALSALKASLDDRSINGVSIYRAMLAAAPKETP